MTAPTGDDALREAVNLALKDTQRQHGWLLATGILADALLPVVLRHGREKAAEELLDAARDWQDIAQDPTVATWLPEVAWLRYRADALTAEDPT